MTNKVARILWVTAFLVVACSTPAAAPLATQPPDPTAPVVAATKAPAAGPGKITFGTKINTDTLFITTVKDTWKTSSKKIWWSASFSEAAGADTLKFIVASRSGSGTEKVLYTEKVEISDPRADIVANYGDLAGIVKRKAGTYVVRYLRGATVLAEGTFRLVK